MNSADAVPDTTGGPEPPAVKEKNQWPAGSPRRRGPAPRLLAAHFGRRTWAEFGYAVAGLPLAIAGWIRSQLTDVVAWRARADHRRVLAVLRYLED